MPTKFSIDGRLLAGLELRGMPVAEFAIVCARENIRGASKTVLNESFRDVRPLKNEVALQAWALWQEIDGMCQQFEPFTLDLSDGERTWNWLQARRAGTVFSIVVSGQVGESSEGESRR